MTPEELKEKFANRGKNNLAALKARASKAIEFRNRETKPSPSNEPITQPSDENKPIIVPFGRYKGCQMEDLLADQGYVDWIISQPGMVKDLKRRYPAFGTALEKAIGSGTERKHLGTEKPRLQEKPRDFAFYQLFVKKSYKILSSYYVTTLNPTDTKGYNFINDELRKMQAALNYLRPDSDESEKAVVLKALQNSYRLLGQ